ncbi:hypothetical protein JCM24511_07250 [Saitozyma sp. JCM 24511]|nr:hypothetical protein JCM24511_07250 [Saitozyma sp. JCM 24511]
MPSALKPLTPLALADVPSAPKLGRSQSVSSTSSTSSVYSRSADDMLDRLAAQLCYDRPTSMPSLRIIVSSPIYPGPITCPAATSCLPITPPTPAQAPANTPQPDATFHLWSAGNVRLNNLDLTIPAREAAELVKVMRDDERFEVLTVQHLGEEGDDWKISYRRTTSPATTPLPSDSE